MFNLPLFLKMIFQPRTAGTLPALSKFFKQKSLTAGINKYDPPRPSAEKLEEIAAHNNAVDAANYAQKGLRQQAIRNGKYRARIDRKHWKPLRKLLLSVSYRSFFKLQRDGIYA